MSLHTQSKSHHGVALDVTPGKFDSGSASFGSVFVDEDDPDTTFLFYSGAATGQMWNSAIGLASSRRGSQFRKEDNESVLRGSPGSFCFFQSLVPVVTRIGQRFYMVLAGKPTLEAPRRIGLAYSDDPKGPWHVIGELVKPAGLWEGNGIDNGPSIARIDEETIAIYYSSITTPKAYDITAFLRRYPVRRVGILKVRVRGTSSSTIEVMRYSGNPLRHLNGARGSWNESVFCPGYTKMGDTHYLFPAGSTYSVGYPYRQYIGLATSSTPYFGKTCTSPAKLIDGPKEKHAIIPNARGEIALDTPCPYVDREKQNLHLYYSVADRADEKWKIALTTFKLGGD